jgi:Phage integrase family
MTIATTVLAPPLLRILLCSQAARSNGSWAGKWYEIAESANTLQNQSICAACVREHLLKEFFRSSPGWAEPIPLSQYACEVLQAWKKESPLKSDYVFPSPVVANKPISTVKTAWKATLRRAGVTAFPIYNLRHVFCTRLSEVAPDAVVQRAMHHTSPETKRHYQLGMAEQVRQAVEKTNKRLYGKRAPLHFRDSLPQKREEEKIAVCK